MDDVVQPVVERLPDGVSCFDVARMGNRLAFLSGVMIDLGGGGKFSADSFLLAAFRGLIFAIYASVIANTEMMTNGKTRRLNIRRHNTVDILSTWVWIGTFLRSFVTFICGVHDFLSLTVVSSFCVMLVFLRAQPRPPGTPRTAIFPSLSSMLPQGGAA